MKKVELVAVGDLKEKYFISAADEYIKRLGRFCSLKITQLSESTAADASNKESSDILSKLDGGTVILLDKSGEELSSEGFSKFIDSAFLSSPKLTFIIGGSTGVDGRVKNKADRLISFGKITFPHRLMRVIFLEQLYRAFTIAHNLPYHK